MQAIRTLIGAVLILGALGFGERGNAVECMAIQGQRPKKSLNFNITFWQFPGFMLQAMGPLSDHEDLEKITDEAQNALEKAILHHPEPSPELDLIYSKFVNRRLAEATSNLKIFKILRQYAGEKSNEIFFTRFDKARLRVDLDDDCDAFVTHLTAAEKAGVIAVRKKNSDAVTAAYADLEASYESFRDANLEALDETAIERHHEPIRAHLKVLLNARYTEIFQLRRVLGSEKTALYLQRLTTQRAKYDRIRLY